MLASTAPMDEGEIRPAKPLARPREQTSTDSAKGEAESTNSNGLEDSEGPATIGTPDKPPRSRPRRGVLDDGPETADDEPQGALGALTQAAPSKPFPRAKRTIGLDDDDQDDDMEAPTALPEGALRVRLPQPQRTQNRTNLNPVAYRALTCACMLAIVAPPHTPGMSDECALIFTIAAGPHDQYRYI